VTLNITAVHLVHNLLESLPIVVALKSVVLPVVRPLLKRLKESLCFTLAVICFISSH
jgi:hypothetical protein